MKYILTLITLAILNLISPPAAAAMKMPDTVTVGNISVSAAWSRSSAGMKRTGAAFVTISNSGTTDDRLIAASTPVAKKAGLHTIITDAGIMKMRRIQDVLIPAGKTVKLTPSGMHVMLFKLSQTLDEGDHYPLTLTFKKAGDVPLMVEVKKAGAMGEMKMNGMKEASMPND